MIAGQIKRGTLFYLITSAYHLLPREDTFFCINDIVDPDCNLKGKHEAKEMLISSMRTTN